MKLGKAGQVALVTATALGVATLFTACSTLTVGFLFVATTRQTPGQIEVYEVNSESGALRTIPTSPFPSGGRDPIAEAVSPDFKNLYVANQDDNNIVQSGIGTDGKLYAQNTVNTPGSFPLAIAINGAGTYLYVVDTLTPVGGCSLTNPCPGLIAAYPLNADGSLGQTLPNSTQYPNYWPLLLSPSNPTTVLTPTALNVTANGSFVYVSAYNPSASNAGYVFAFSVGSDGTLTPLNGGVPFSIGSQPVALISDSSNGFLYVADRLKNSIYSFSIGGDGLLTQVGTTGTGSQPSAMTLDANQHLFVTNSQDATVTTYGVGAGTLTNLATNTVGSNPVAITEDPRQVGFLYTVNFLGSSLSGFQINPTSGVLTNTKTSPYASTVQPTAIAGIPHSGNVSGSLAKK
jgi:6-phosphogluconolactonase